MRKVSALPPPLAARLAGQDLIIFDGECVLCSGFFRFMLRHDRAGRFAFATAQGQLGQDIYRALDLPTDAFETNLVVIDGVIYERLDAFAAAMRALGWPHRALGAVRYLPSALKDPAYHAIARNRYRLFGRYDHCILPTAETRARFLDAA